ncbi:prepilin-type N-terminal cleavage/methylation domain-containing protein [bacterium]|nr:prepilin-type N-terminal cleavage/methylation domain-containing protein [bacterium]
MKEKFKNNLKTAFTLAEVLITLGVIGVVAAITMPTVIANINERVNSERHANIAMKVTQAMEQMRAHGLLNNTYPSTESFVDELQKYLKIAKRCDSSHIAECWPTEKVIDSNGDEFEISKAKTGKNLSLSTETNNVGLVLADGASMILNYNPSETFTLDVGDGVTAYKKLLPIGGGKEKEFAYSTNVTNSIDFITDVNGGKGPNKEKSDKYYDIRNLRGAKFAKGCAGVEVEGVGCIVNLNINVNQANAIKACSDAGMELPDFDTLKNICQKVKLYSDFPHGDFWSSTYGNRGIYISFDYNSCSENDTVLVYEKHGVLCIAR